ncbi:ATP-binding protein [Candidatus Poribacteria bacterium]|nr:ATP-binding protein [Candidatus Poribacteria bacterium]
MNRQEKVTLTIPSILGYEEVVVETVGAVARVKRYPFEKTSKLQTAVAEACVNAIEHGNKENPEKDVIVTIICAESSMVVSIKDFGEGHIKPPDFQMPDLKKQIEEKKLGGWGMYLMRTLVDKLEVDSEPGDGTTTTMIIYP